MVPMAVAWVRTFSPEVKQHGARLFDCARTNGAQGSLPKLFLHRANRASTSQTIASPRPIAPPDEQCRTAAHLRITPTGSGRLQKPAAAEASGLAAASPVALPVASAAVLPDSCFSVAAPCSSRTPCSTSMVVTEQSSIEGLAVLARISTAKVRPSRHVPIAGCQEYPS